MKFCLVRKYLKKLISSFSFVGSFQLFKKVFSRVWRFPVRIPAQIFTRSQSLNQNFFPGNRWDDSSQSFVQHFGARPSNLEPFAAQRRRRQDEVRRRQDVGQRRRLWRQLRRRSQPLPKVWHYLVVHFTRLSSRFESSLSLKPKSCCTYCIDSVVVVNSYSIIYISCLVIK